MPIIYDGLVENRDGAVNIPETMILNAKCETERIQVGNASISTLLESSASSGVKPIDVVLTAEAHDQSHVIHVTGRERPRGTVRTHIHWEDELLP